MRFRYLAIVAVLWGGLTVNGIALAAHGVQIGAFASPQNAVRAASRLHDAGFGQVISVARRTSGGMVHAVVVGPFERRADAERTRERLDAGGWPGFVTSYPVLKGTSVRMAPMGAIGALSSLPRQDFFVRAAATTPAPAREHTEPAAPSQHLPSSSATISRVTGYAATEWRLFPHDALDPRQHGDSLALALRPEFYRRWGRADSLIFTPFLRVDQHDAERSHADINELLWQRVGQAWEIRAGIGKVFWGVTESQHLVDVINQTDLVENIDLEEKLGQPMVNVTLIRDWGNLNLFVLPGFRERTFPGPDGRLRTQPHVDIEQTRYESGAAERHVDVAARWSRVLGDWDLGVAHFSGTGREPRLLPGLDGAGNIVLTPYYEQIQQTSVDVQATLDAWLWKLEILTRRGQDSRHTALTGGFEYTLVGILDTPADLGLIAEYLFDDRDDTAPTPFEDDVMIGVRLSPNDAQSSELLLGAIVGLDGDGVLYSLEANRRFGERWKLGIEARVFSNVAATSVLASQRDDDYLQIDVARYF